MEIIAEQNEEIRRQEMADRLRDLRITGAHEGLSGPAQLLLNVARANSRLSIASSSYSPHGSLQTRQHHGPPPPVIISPSAQSRRSSAASAGTRCPSPPSQVGSASLLQLRDSHPHFKGKKERRSSRRQSSIEGMAIKGRRRGLSISSAPAQRWKTGSLILSRGFRK
ncbi:unnamed protein product, partial [Mesorhabditis spiculigera]